MQDDPVPPFPLLICIFEILTLTLLSFLQLVKRELKRILVF